jgi:hypothetical protein
MRDLMQYCALCVPRSLIRYIHFRTEDLVKRVIAYSDLAPSK